MCAWDASQHVFASEHVVISFMNMMHNSSYECYVMTAHEMHGCIYRAMHQSSREALLQLGCMPHEAAVGNDIVHTA